MVQTAQPDLFLGAGGGSEEAALAECQTWALMHQDDDDFNAPIPFGWRPPLTEMDTLINGGDFGAMSLEGGGGGGGLAGDFFSPPEGLPDGPLGAAKKWPCLSHLYVKNDIVLPRQARDNHRTSVEKEAAAFCAGPLGRGRRRRLRATVRDDVIPFTEVRKRIFFAPVYAARNEDHFTKTGSGQT